MHGRQLRTCQPHKLPGSALAQCQRLCNSLRILLAHPAEECFPGDGYANIGAVAPLMGNHAVGMMSPELQAFQAGGNAVAAWNETWIWGFFGSKAS